MLKRIIVVTKEKSNSRGNWCDEFVWPQITCCFEHSVDTWHIMCHTLPLFEANEKFKILN